MRRFDPQSSERSNDPSRLETPTMAGYRSGLSSSGVIGHKLGIILGIDADIPHEMDSALRELQDKLRRGDRA